MTLLPRLIGAIALSLVVAGCAATSEAPAGPESATDSPRVELRLRRVADHAGGPGGLRMREADLAVEYRAAGGAGADAGEVTLDGVALSREGDPARGRYRLRGDALERVPLPGTAGATLAHSGGPALGAGSVRVELAPWPRAMEPSPGQSRTRAEGLVVVLEPPPAPAWHRVSIEGGGGGATARDDGLGRWSFSAADLQSIAPGPARVIVEAQTSCAACGSPALAARWTTTSVLEIPIQLF
jgi:hypothetical protein